MNAPKKAAAFSAMIPATAPPANRANRAETQKRLIIAGCAFSIPIRTDSRCSEEQEAGARNPGGALASSCQKVLRFWLFVKAARHLSIAWTTAANQRLRKSSSRRLIASVIMQIKPAIRRRPRIVSRTNGPRYATSGLPLFSKSSSNASDGKIIAHPAGRLCRLANASADPLSRKIPPILPLASRATQKPCVLRPMKNAGIASLTMFISSG